MPLDGGSFRGKDWTGTTVVPMPPGRHKQRWIKSTLLLIFTIGLATYFILGGEQWLRPETIRANQQHWLTYTQTHYWGMLAFCTLLYTLTTALSVPGAWMRSLAIGFLFGPWVGTAVIVLSASSGAVVVFIAVRYLFADSLGRRFERSPTATRLIRGFRRDAFNYLLFLRLVPMFPFWLVNLVPALTLVRVRTYAAATAIGIAPGSYALAALGQSLALVQPAGNPLSTGMIGALVVLGLLALAPVFLKNYGPAHEGE